MSSYVVRRVAAMPALLLAVVTVTFLITRLIPASPLTSILGPRALTDPSAVAAAEEHWGLNGPLIGQYWHYLDNMLHGDFATSFVTKNNVATDLGVRLPATLELMTAAIIVAVIGGIGIGGDSQCIEDGGFGVLGMSRTESSHRVFVSELS